MQLAAIPVVQADKALELLGHQQRLPLPGLLAGAAVDDFRHPYAETRQGIQRLPLAQNGGTAEGVLQRAIQMANLALAVKRRQRRATPLQALHTAFAIAALVGCLNPFALGVPPALESAGQGFTGGQDERPVHVQLLLRST
ncbi:hypothetical protein D9M68_779110 [compost metagenome]